VVFPFLLVVTVKAQRSDRHRSRPWRLDDRRPPCGWRAAWHARRVKTPNWAGERGEKPTGGCRRGGVGV
jgi:hypothetical protein